MASTSYNQTQSSSFVLSSPPTQYDVFLSFRGIDTRYKFTDHLYNALHRIGIRTFRDNPEIRSGDVISRALPQAIHESKTYIVVFSENYASSRWCLDELEEIYSCHQTMQRSVIPVFYNIDPSVVRHQFGSFGEAFEQHQVRFDMEKVIKWRLTLTEVAGFSGYHISENRYEADSINEIVDRILYEINPKTFHVAKYPVGLDSRVKDIMALLSSGTEGVIRIGMYGMGGVGKTTLAKAVFNQYYHQFQGSCFLANVRVVSKKHKGIVCLQQQLVNDVLKRKNINIDDADQGIILIKDLFCLIKVLIVIDDLDDLKPLQYLGPFALGSTIIITTRNEDLLDDIEVEARYKVKELDDAESLQLFTQHAFGHDIISNAFMELSQEIIECAGGLPLALEVFGSNLHKKSEEGWKWFIEKLKRVPVNDVEKILLISFTAMDLDYLRDIFLDIACFFVGQEEEEIVKILETCYSSVTYNINILKKRSLLTIINRDKLGMHHLLRDMGRKIVRNKYPDDPGKHSRLWISKDICHVLKKQEGTEAIQGIIPDKLYYQDAPEGLSFATETFKRMSKLRLLYLENMNITGSFECTFEDLRMLFWKCCPLQYLPSEFYPQKLVTLSLPHSKMRTIWDLNKVSQVSQVFEKLKTLNMSYSLELTTTPDFTKLPYLETLNLEGCKSLEEVHISIGSLVRLVSLNLCGCVKLRSFPDTFCNLIALEVLCIAKCSSLQAFSEKLSNIEILKPAKVSRLREIDAGGATMFKKLPISQFLNPDNFDFRECHHLLSISELPPNLKQMMADDCRSLKRAPNLFNLKHLEILTFTDCNGLTEIQGLEELTSIRKLHVGGCNSSLLQNTLTEHIFQIYSGFGHQIQVYTSSAEFPDWIQSSNLGLTVPLPLPSHDFLAMILCFKQWEDNLEYRVENITSDIVWKDSAGNYDKESLMVILPRIIFSARDGDNNIVVNATAEIHGIHLLFKTEMTMTDEYNNTDVGDERSCPSKRLKHSCKNRLS